MYYLKKLADIHIVDMEVSHFYYLERVRIIKEKIQIFQKQGRISSGRSRESLEMWNKKLPIEDMN